jgi:membrane peptidoglycan carboxypeptidase
MISTSPRFALRAAKLAYIALWLFLVSYNSAWGQPFEGGDLPSLAEIRERYQDVLRDRDEMPQLLRLAFVAADDPNFFESPLRHSLFTEQVIKSNFIRFAETPVILRLRIHLISLKIEETLSHDEVLSLYMSRVWLGRGCYGVLDAAFAYFGREASDLGIGEVAYLAALPKYPSYLNNPEFYDIAIRERNRVIDQMYRLNFISSQEATIAKETVLSISGELSRCQQQ